MVRVIDYGETIKRKEQYFKTHCVHCGAELIFEYNDIWWEDPIEGIGRIECPVCRTKTFFESPTIIFDIAHLEHSTRDEYDRAYKDTSKRGIEMLMMEKANEKED